MIPSTVVSQDSIEGRMMLELHKALDAEFKKITERIIADATQQFANELRAKIGNTACSLASYYSVERAGGNLVITVKIQEGK